MTLVFVLPNNKVARPKHWLQSDGTSADFAELDNIADAAHAAVISSGLMANFPEDTSFVRAEAQNFVADPTITVKYPHGRTKPITSAVLSTGATVPGTVVSDSVVPQGALVYSSISATPGPSGRGRAYYPPPAESVTNSDGSVATATRDAIFNDLNTILGAATAAADPDAVVGILSGKDDAFYDAVQGFMVPLIRTQRRRALRAV